MLDDARGGQLLYFEDFGGGGEEEDSRWLDRHLPSQGATPLESLEDDRFREALIGAIDALPEREKLLMSLYYEQELNFREIAAVLGVSESRVCQLHTQAVARLRSRLV
jgi:RNA polymerase sigma factor FliA